MEYRPVERPAHAGYLGQLLHQGPGVGMAGSRDLLQTLRSQQCQVQGGGGHHQALIGANVGRGFGTADVLFARLQGQGKTGLAIQIDGTADQAAGHLPYPFLPTAQEPEIGTARGQRRPQRLTIATNDIGAAFAPFTRRFENGQRRGIDHRDRQRLMAMRPIGKRVHLLQHSEEIGLRDHQCREILSGISCQRLNRRMTARRIVGDFHQLDALIVDDGMRGTPIQRMQGTRDQNPLGFGFTIGAYRHQQRFRQCRGPVVQRSVGHRHGGQTRHHALIFVKHLQRALTGFRLIGRIRAVELAAANDFPDRRRNVVFVGARTEEARRPRIVRRARFQ